MGISSNPSHSEIESELSASGSDSSSLRDMLDNAFGDPTANMKKFANLNDPDGTTDGADNITDDSGTVYGTINEAGGDSDLDVKYKFRYGNSDMGYSDTSTSSVSGTFSGQVSKDLTGLPSGSNIEYRFKIYNPLSGWWDNGDPAGFNTDAGLPYNLSISWTQQDFTADATAHWSNDDDSTTIEFQFEQGRGNGFGSTSTLSAGTTSHQFTSAGDGVEVRFRVRYQGQSEWATSSYSTSPGGTGGSCLVKGTQIIIPGENED